jgi:hypothetical protein
MLRRLAIGLGYHPTMHNVVRYRRLVYNIRKLCSLTLSRSLWYLLGLRTEELPLSPKR